MDYTPLTHSKRNLEYKTIIAGEPWAGWLYPRAEQRKPGEPGHFHQAENRSGSR